MADKLSWNPPKWKSYSFDGTNFKVELETGEVYKGTLDNRFIVMRPNHSDVCEKIFGQSFTPAYDNKLSELSKALDLKLENGNWPEFHDISKFLERYYERVAKIGNSNISNISKICIETGFDVTPKFTI